MLNPANADGDLDADRCGQSKCAIARCRLFFVEATHEADPMALLLSAARHDAVA